MSAWAAERGLSTREDHPDERVLAGSSGPEGAGSAGPRCRPLADPMGYVSVTAAPAISPSSLVAHGPVRW